MTFKIIPLLAIAAVIVGCQSSGSTATNTTPSTSNPATTADNSTKAADNNAPTTDTGTGVAAFAGKWTSDEKDATGVVFDFTDDGTMTATGPAPADFPKGTTMEANATLKVDGDKATLHMTGMKVIAAPDADDATKKKIDATNALLSDPKKQQLPPDATGTVKWDGKDSFSVTDDKTKKTVTYKRAS